jgi:hypothetical protein
VNDRHDPENKRSPLRWTRWSGPGLAFLVLTGAGSYALFTRYAASHGGDRAPAPGAPPTLDARASKDSRPAAVGARAARPPLAPPSGSPTSLSGPGAAPSAPPSVQAEARAHPEQTMAERRESVRQAANQFRHGRFNAFFREEKFLAEFAQGGPAQLAALTEELSDASALAGLPADTDFLRGKPDAVLERMSMIDMLHSLAPGDPGAREAMVSLLMEPVDSTLPDVAKKSLVGEKFDLLFRLAQLDRQLAVDSFTQLDSPKLKSLLREALIAGLSESGAPLDEVKRLTRHL